MTELSAPFTRHRERSVATLGQQAQAFDPLGRRVASLLAIVCWYENEFERGGQRCSPLLLA